MIYIYIYDIKFFVKLVLLYVILCMCPIMVYNTQCRIAKDVVNKNGLKKLSLTRSTAFVAVLLL